MIWFLASVLAAILVALIIAYKRTSSKDEVVSPSPIMSGVDTSIEQAQIGDSVVIQGAGDNFQDLSFTIDRRDRYECGDDEWFEVSGRYNGRRVFVEISHDDDVEVLVNLTSEKLTIGDLGVTEEDLVRMDDSHDTSESFSYNNSLWQFEGSDEIGFFEDCGSEGDGYYNWDFHEKGGSRKISIEKWEGEPFEVIVSRQVNMDDVQILHSRLL